jgi:hypothetical protein
MFVSRSDEMSNLYRGTSIDASYQASVHLAEGFQRRRLKCEKLTDDRRRTLSDEKTNMSTNHTCIIKRRKHSVGQRSGLLPIFCWGPWCLSLKFSILCYFVHCIFFIREDNSVKCYNLPCVRIEF